RNADWTAQLTESGDELLLIPRLQPDPRFDYRVRDVPAASHPTVAAALARLSAPRSDDVIWDPFVGSALELIECAKLSPAARVLGSDPDPRALSAARENLERAGISKAELSLGDASTFTPEGVTLIVSNPPMGRRVARDGTLPRLLEAFVAHAADVLGRHGR